jgi:toxin ParE1/3/4
VIPVVWARAALTDVQRIRSYIADFNPHAAREMAARILRAGDGLATFPFRGQAVPNCQVREIIVAPPYIIRYRVESDRVVILRVRHGARQR